MSRLEVVEAWFSVFLKKSGLKMAQAVEDWYKQMPIITRSYLTAAIVTTIGCSLEVFFFLSISYSLSKWLNDGVDEFKRV